MSTPPTKLHDAFFKSFMSKPELAGRFLQEHLPSDVVELLAPEPPVRVPGSFVGEDFAQNYADLLFQLRLKTGDPVLAYLLLEHKSSPDAGTPLQLLRYIVRILARWYKEHKRLPLPVVLPLVAHQGPGNWKFSTAFIDLFGSVPKPLHPYLVSFRHALVDLPRIEDDALSADTRLGAYLKALKYGRRNDLPQRIEVILVPKLADVDMADILRYIAVCPRIVSVANLHTGLRFLERSRREKIMRHFTQEIEAIGEARGRAEGKAQGRVEGKAQGRVEGQGRALLRLLERRFGTVPSRLRERIATADVASIEAWFERALDAHDLNSVFESSEMA
jgi:predicted transposase YdaD